MNMKLNFSLLCSGLAFFAAQLVFASPVQTINPGVTSLVLNEESASTDINCLSPNFIGCSWGTSSVSYALNVVTPGQYQLQLTASSWTTGGTATVYVNGVSAGSFAFPSSGGYYNYSVTPALMIHLPAGAVTLTLGGMHGGTINISNITLTSFSLAVNQIVNASGVTNLILNEALSESGIGCLDASFIGCTYNGSVTYGLSVAVAGQYKLQLDASTWSSNRTVQILLNGSSAGTISLPNQGSYYNYAYTSAITIDLPAGISTLTLSGLPSNAANFSGIMITSMMTLPVDAREVTFPSNAADMAAWGVWDVTQGGASIGCPNALPNKTDAASVTQTTQAIQCRLNLLGQSTPSFIWNQYPASLYFPAGSYYINKALSLTVGYWTTNSSGANIFVKYGVVARSGSTGLVKISGENPATTKILWAGSCGADPNVANPSTFTKYNDIFYISGVHPLTIERLTLDGQNCAGDGIDMVSSQGIISGVHINEMNIQNLKEVGIVGDRSLITKSEMLSGDGSGMVSEVTISQVNFSNIGYAGVLANTYNALDYWIRDSVFSNCNIGVTSSAAVQGVWGMSGAPALKWPNAGYGGFEVANSFFQNSTVADIVQPGWNAPTGIRNNYSIASHGPFVSSAAGVTLIQGNTVVAAKGIIPITLNGGTDGVPTPVVSLINNKFITQNNGPAILGWTFMYGSWPYSAFQGASAGFGQVFDETYASVASFGNEYTSTEPYSTASLSAYQADTGIGLIGNMPGWAPSSSFYQCGPTGDASAEIDNRTYCHSANPQNVPAFNLATAGDRFGVSLSATPPLMPPFRPEIHRNYIVPTGLTNNTSSAAASLVSATANTTILQNAINTLAAKAAACPAGEYYCPDRMGILFIPSGQWPIESTLNVPGNVPLQIVGTGESVLYWAKWTGQPAPAGSGPSAIFNFQAPSHVVMRDLMLEGMADVHNPNSLGEGFVAEVVDSPSSRVITDNMRNGGSFTVDGIGNTPFEMRGFANGGWGTITGTGAGDSGYFAYFGGNPSNLFVGKGANLMIQDTWYEGSNSAMVTCASGDSADVTVESSMLSMGGWHGTSATTQTTFNLTGCNTKTTVVDSVLERQGWSGIAPTQSLVLPAGGSASTQVLLLNDSGNNSTYGNGQETIPTTYTGASTSLDQGYLLVEPGADAHYANVEGTFLQSAATNGGSGYVNVSAKNTGNLTGAYVESLLGQAVDPRQSAPSTFVPPITNMSVTDIQMYNVSIQGTRMDMQFIKPGATAQ